MTAPSSAMRGAVALEAPVELYLEVTNRCNLRCATCPQSWGMSEAPADLSPAQVERLLAQLPTVQRVVLHGIGEPTLNPQLPEIIAVVKARQLSLVALALTRHGWLLVASLFAAIAAAAFIRVALDRWANFQTNAYDLAFFDQVISNTAHGEWFQTSFLRYNFLGEHFQPVLLLFAGAYRFGAGPAFLLTVQGVVAAAAAVPLALAARKFGSRPAVAVAFAAAYLLSPYLHSAVNFDFHPEVMLALPAFLSLWAIASGRFRLAAGAALSCLLFKEDAVFVILALAAIMNWRGAPHAATVPPPSRSFGPR